MSTEKTNIPVPEEQVGAAEDVKSVTERKESAPATPGETPVAAEEKSAPATPAAPVAAEEEDENGTEGRLDFAEEDAALAAAQSGLDMGEATEEEKASAEGSDAEAETARMLAAIAGMDKHALVDCFATLLTSRPVQQIRREAEAIKVAFYKLHRAEYEQRKRAFLEAGGAPEEFASQPDADEAKLKELFADYRRRRADYLAGIEKEKEANLRKRLQIIEELKELTNGTETTNSTFNTFRELQQRWREAGVVPQANVKELWETYNLYVENFYNYIKINKELRDLDLKRNYETKLQLCEAAEALLLEPSIVTAFRKLQDLHDQWRETGPVANEYKEALWERFKEASTRINKQHQ